MRELIATQQFKKDLSKIPREIMSRADKMILQLRNDPLSPSLDIRKLAGIASSVYRVRIGSYRLMYSFTKISFFLHRFRHRKDIYRNLRF